MFALAETDRKYSTDWMDLSGFGGWKDLCESTVTEFEREKTLIEIERKPALKHLWKPFVNE